MLYGGPLGTYLSGYYAPKSSKGGSPSNFPGTGSGSGSTSGISRSRGSRYRAPSAYGGSGGGGSSNTPTNSIASTSSASGSRSNFYTPQTRRKYSDDSTESTAAPSRSWYTGSGTPVTSGTTSGYYSRPSPGYAPSTTPSSFSRAATLSPSQSMNRRTKSQDRYRRLQDMDFYGQNSLPFRTSNFLSGWEPSVDYKRLYEAEKQDTQELRGQIDRAQQELKDLRARIEEARKTHKSTNSDQRPAEHQTTESEGDAKVLEELRAASEKLKAENRALTRVISRLM
uniref:PRKG1_interact domain-containing protein n=1 Tax=Mesocestoides corti TaxID=53468 RepID=A0A5K3FER8_MESCO